MADRMVFKSDIELVLSYTQCVLYHRQSGCGHTDMEGVILNIVVVSS